MLCFCSLLSLVLSLLFFFKQKTAYEMRISDWSSDVCSSDLIDADLLGTPELLHSCGRPMKDVEIGIFDPESGQPLPDGEIGELWARGGQRSLGYWENPAATAAEFLEGGWFRTGDMGRIEEGYLYIREDRKSVV